MENAFFFWSLFSFLLSYERLLMKWDSIWYYLWSMTVHSSISNRSIVSKSREKCFSSLPLLYDWLWKRNCEEKHSQQLKRSNLIYYVRILLLFKVWALPPPHSSRIFFFDRHEHLFCFCSVLLLLLPLL